MSKKENKKCPEPESNQRHEDFQSSALPTELSGQNSGDRIWTYDLRVMSPTSFQTAPPRGKKIKWAEMDSNHRSITQQIYSLSPLATRESTHLLLLATSCFKQKADDRTRTDNLLITNQLLCQLSHIGIFNCQMTPTGFEPVLPPWKGDVLTAWPRSQNYFGELFYNSDRKL